MTVPVTIQEGYPDWQASAYALAEAILADHPFDAGEAMTAALRDSPLNDFDSAFEWARTNVRPSERNIVSSAQAGMAPYGTPPWLIPEGRAWSNVHGRKYPRLGWDTHRPTKG